MSHVMKDRHPESNILELRLCVSKDGLAKGLLKQSLGYAFSRNVENLNLELKCKHAPFKLSTLSSKLLKKLTLQLKLVCASEFDFWDLPALTTLHLKRPVLAGNHKLPYSCLTCLPALRTLCLDDWDLSFPNYCFSLPHLTTLRLSRCLGIPVLWKFPGLLTLELDHVNVLAESASFLKLVNLQNLTLTGVCFKGNTESAIYFPHLLNLDIRTTRVSDSDRFKFSTPKLCNFTSVGIFSISLKAPELENVYLKLQGCFGNMEWIFRKQYYQRFQDMLSQLGNAKNLTFDLESIKALSVISKELAAKPSPFYNLKYVKLPHEYNESTISSAVRSYLLGGSSRGTIVTTFPRNTIPHSEAASMTAQNAVLQEPLAVPTKELDDTQYIHQTKSVNTININVQEEHVVEDSVDADRVRDINPLVKETGKDRVSSSVGNRDFGLWWGHKVNSEFVCLLDRIMSKYPETFENLTKKNKNSCTMNLNMLCTSINDFTKICMSEVDSEMLVEYRDVFAYLQNKGFNVSWVVRRLDYIEHLRFSKTLIPELYANDCRIGDEKSKLQELQSCVDDAKIEQENLQARVDAAKTKLQNVQTLRVEKLTEIEKAFGIMDTKLAVGFIGDDLLS